MKNADELGAASSAGKWLASTRPTSWAVPGGAATKLLSLAFRAPRDNLSDATRWPRLAYPAPLVAEDVAEMDEVLPAERPAAAGVPIAIP